MDGVLFLYPYRLIDILRNVTSFILSLTLCHGVGGKDFFELIYIMPSKDKRVAN